MAHRMLAIGLAMRRALSRRMIGVAGGALIALFASAAIWNPPAETCGRRPAQAEALRTPVSAPRGRIAAEMIDGLARSDRARGATEVVGRVVDARGHAVAGVLVVPRPTRGGGGQDPLGGGVLTDRSGRFRFIGLTPGQYWFVAIHARYPFGSTPAMPVSDRLDVSITLDDLTSRT
jgi:protocatechuate 3,4-dioxygenase beta subunit